MNHCVSLSLTNRKSYVHLHALYSPCTALRTFTPRRDLWSVARFGKQEISTEISHGYIFESSHFELGCGG
jgi:hypothetical protein